MLCLWHWGYVTSSYLYVIRLLCHRSFPGKCPYRLMSDTPHLGAFITSTVSLFNTPVTWWSGRDFYRQVWKKKSDHMIPSLSSRFLSRLRCGYLQAEESLHGLQILAEGVISDASHWRVCHPNIRVELRKITLIAGDESLALLYWRLHSSCLTSDFPNR